MDKQVAVVNGTPLRRSSRQSKIPRPSTELHELVQPDPKRRRSAKNRLSKTEAPLSPAPAPIVSDEIVISAGPGTEGGIEAIAETGIDEEDSLASSAPPWCPIMLSQYGTWMRQLTDVRWMEERRCELLLKLDKVYEDLSMHEHVKKALSQEELEHQGPEVSESTLGYLRHLDEEIASFDRELEEDGGPGGRKGGTRCIVELLSLGPHAIAGWDDQRLNALCSAAHGMAADDGDSPNGKPETEADFEAEWDMGRDVE
ncbi:hypothetical protein FMUND_12632 [Fusarium mundagurra]|uniref:Uncharacterized protein n=1 Tax=Fusarium mundagurra TaxID=1567541 RepID=A0A8H5Y1I9_9HYPO|nr:hypothetical protein FMUND_12632 [Fusarium mundagurra]